jgi:hypothetical protein
MAEVRVTSQPPRKWDWEKALRDRSIAEGLSSSGQHIALVLATYADGEGRNIRPTAETVASVSGRSRAAVFAALRELRESGWIRQVSRGAGAARRASEYTLAIPARVQESALQQNR